MMQCYTNGTIKPIGSWSHCEHDVDHDPVLSALLDMYFLDEKEKKIKWD